jgi:predicted nucleic acid-binding protein
MLTTLTFDTEPIVAFFFGEPEAKVVIEFLQKIQSKDIEGYINIVNLAEVYYTIARGDPEAAKIKIKRLRQFGLKVVPINEDSDLWREAALIKNKYLLSLGDAFAVATAQTTKSKLVIGKDKKLNNMDIPLIRMR